ncbi:hypothetical protein CTAYLR_007737 [Chrysophaeum taylorii]|uniref:Tetratricopeptide repeat protein n=1 Tax=Chrysophaeum taylorii TaxID=2483200 RepID=A0AAD7UN49_9STRA|nr:hypothetical protein CTAYLR_007737 [Chrysophaeum taylorii]
MEEEVKRELVHALRHLESGEFGLAEDCYAAALELAIDDPIGSRILGYLARACAAQGKHKMAIAMYERALADSDGLDRVSLELDLVGLYRAVGRDEDADVLRGEVDAKLMKR